MRVLAKFLAPSRFGWRLLAIVLLCAATALVQAQSSADNDSADPPSRVARLSYISGDLGFLPAGAKDWSDASINRPLTTGDRLSTSRGSRAELELGGGTLLMDGQTDFGMLNLNDQLAQIELTQGTLNLTVRHLDQGQSYEIDTPTVALVVDQPGSFRVDIGDNGGSTQVTAFNGGATVYGENNAQRTINPGRSYRFADSSLAAVTISDIDGGDAFDSWVSGRDRRYVQSRSRQYVSDDVVGYQDLDQYGDWQTTSDYGEVWYPTQVAVDWAPYRDGHWAYIAPWGWTWVDDSPWGFAPYHYGRWAYTHRGWGWIPGPREVRPIYAPALVAFVGGGGWSVGISSGPVGWFPLGPGEVYNPWYRASRNYYTRVNVTNINVHNTYNQTTIINNINHSYNNYRSGQPVRDGHYANREAPRGFTAVPGNTFAGGRHVQRNLVKVDPRRLAAAPVLSRGASQLRPVAEARPALSAHARSLPAGGFNREVVARHAPPMVAQDTREPGRNSRLAKSPRAGMPASSNVRVLNAGDNRDRGARPVPADRVGNERDNGRVGNDVARRPAGTPQQPQAATRITAGTPPPAARDNNRPEVRGEAGLPSARFAHPRGRDNVDQRESMPRPGVSYISGAGENQPRPAYRNNSSLPQVPQIQRADQNPGNNRDVRNAPASEERGQHYQSGRTVRQDLPTPAPMRNNEEPRFQRAEPPARAEPPRAEPAPRSYVRERPQSMPEPARNEPPRRPAFQPPPQQQPRFEPPPRAEAPHPQQRTESRPPPQKNPHRPKDDAQQH
jgi:Cell division protein